MDEEKIARGNALLLPFNLTVESVAALELALDKFRGVAAAKAFAVNHGLKPSEVRQRRDVILARVRAEGDFEDGSLRREKLSRDVVALVGTPRERRDEPVRRAVPDADASNEEKREAQAARAERWGIEALEGKGENLSFPADGPTEENLYADPVNLKFPVETEERAANARVRFKQNAGTYELERSKAIVHERIVRAELRFGIEPSFDPEDPLDALLPADLKDELSKFVRFAKRGEIFVAKSEDEGEDPSKEVRFFGIVAKPNVADSEGDAQTKAEIARANEGFMRDFGTIGLMHKKDVSDKVTLIQNVIAPTDLDFPLPDGGTKKIADGTWYVQLFSDDPPIVEKVRNGQLNGLSFGGRARRVSADEVGPDGPEELALAKRRNFERVEKGEEDPIENWFVGLVVEEFSVVDAGANEEELFFIKRRKDKMTSPEQKQETTEKREGAENQPSPEPQKPPKPPSEEPPKPPEASTEKREGGETPAPTEPSNHPETEAPPPPASPEVDVGKIVADAVKSALAPIDDRLAGLEKEVKEQGERTEKIRAEARGESAPGATTTPPAPEPEKPVSKWAGSAIGVVTERFSGRNRNG